MKTSITSASTLKTAHSTPLRRREDLREDPVEQFTVWLEQAARGALSQPLAAMLATAGTDGRPLARTVLLKFYDAKGFVFFTHLAGLKRDTETETGKALNGT